MWHLTQTHKWTCICKCVTRTHAHTTEWMLLELIDHMYEMMGHIFMFPSQCCDSISCHLFLLSHHSWYWLALFPWLCLICLAACVIKIILMCFLYLGLCLNSPPLTFSLLSLCFSMPFLSLSFLIFCALFRNLFSFMLCLCVCWATRLEW